MERSFDMSEKILVIAEAREGELRNVSFEAIAAAKMIKEDAEIVAVILGNDQLENRAEEMIHYGANRAITVTHENLEHYTSEGYGQRSEERRVGKEGRGQRERDEQKEKKKE